MKTSLKDYLKQPLRCLYPLLLTLTLFGSVSALGQTRTVTGTVKDARGNPLMSVQILIGQEVRAITDAAGMYSLRAGLEDVLSFRFVGMKPVSEIVGKRSRIDVTMKENVSSLEEVIVIGYGTQKRVHVTGSVATVSGKELNAVPVSTPTQLLGGRLPGIIAKQSSGMPGSDGADLMVRGYSSYNGGSSPLILIDGVERNMTYLDPQDIESITVLKDASAAAVYGMRAAQGVILITTKRGRKEVTHISYKGAWTFSVPTAVPRMLNGPDYMKWHNMARELDGHSPFFTPEMIEMVGNGDPEDGFEDTDWMAPLLKTTLMHQHTLSLEGGGEKVSYYLSGGFKRQNGFMEQHRIISYNLRSNVDVHPFENFKLSLDLSGRKVNPYQPTNLSWSNQETGNVVGTLMYAAPWVPMELEGKPTSATRLRINPFEQSRAGSFSESNNYFFESSLKAVYQIPHAEGLSIGLFGAFDINSLSRKTFDVPYQVKAWNYAEMKYVESLGNPYLAYPKGSLIHTHERNTYLLLRPSIEYDHTFAQKHQVNALVLWEQVQRESQTLAGMRQEYDFFTIPELDLGNKIPDSRGDKGNKGMSARSANSGIVGRLAYAYDGKYLAEGSFRYDGSYVFAPAHRRGFFPSLSAGWVVSREDFFKEALSQINHLKLRASIGTLGRNPIAPYLFLKSYAYQMDNVAFGNPPTAGSTLYNKNKFPVEDLTWEKTRTSNVGFELTAWDGLLGLEFDYFYKYTYDILQSSAGNYPPSLGGRFPSVENTGTFDNRGFELVLSHKNKLGDLEYKLQSNVTFARNRILSIFEPDNILPWRSRLGQPVGATYGLISNGLYQTQEEIDNAPLSDLTKNTLRVGDVRYIDYNGDGVINNDDITRVGRSARPELMWGLTGTFSWKGADLSFLLQGASLFDRFIGGQTWKNGANDYSPLTRPFYATWDNSPYFLVENSWRPDNPHARFPRLSLEPNPHNTLLSDFWKYDGTYLRLKNISLGYTFTEELLRALKMHSVRVYCAGMNLLTLSHFKYIDPEAPNMLQAYYPQQRQVSVGVEVNF